MPTDDREYVCPQCGPAPEGPNEHFRSAHEWHAERRESLNDGALRHGSHGYEWPEIPCEVLIIRNGEVIAHAHPGDTVIVRAAP